MELLFGGELHIRGEIWGFLEPREVDGVYHFPRALRQRNRREANRSFPPSGSAARLLRVHREIPRTPRGV